MEQLQERARQLRAAGSSYEAIAEALTGPDRYVLVGDVYALVNPGKSNKQIIAWKLKHAMNDDDRFQPWLETYHPELCR